MRADRWEHGSDYAYPDLDGAAAGRWCPEQPSYWHSGRDALRALVLARAPRRILFPAYYCQDVLAVAEDAAVEVHLHDDTPIWLRRGDLVVVANTFGLGRPSLRAPLGDDVLLVEDHSHDPFSRWAQTSGADYAFASLRKWLPLPDGGILWSPRRAPAVEPPPFESGRNALAAAITLDRLSGMLLKTSYLAGGPVPKDAFRARALAGESAIGHGEASAMSPVARALLDLLPVDAWRVVRAENHAAFVAALGPVDDLVVKSDRLETPAVPFAVILETRTTAQREHLRAELVARAIYPAVLWPLDPDRAPGMTEGALDRASRSLCIHCDHRYTAADMARVAAAVRESCARWR